MDEEHLEFFAGSAIQDYTRTPCRHQGRFARLRFPTPDTHSSVPDREAVPVEWKELIQSGRPQAPCPT